MSSADWLALGLAVLNTFQAIALGWIGLRQAQVKRELDRHNGEQAAAIAALRRELELRAHARL